MADRSSDAAADPLTGLAIDAVQDVLVRRQWDSNGGYCGETSLIAAGMSFGQYASQFTVRALAAPGLPQVEEASQLLLGVNDQAAARRMHLAVSDPSDAAAPPGLRGTARFAAWIRGTITAGARVILAVYVKGEADRDYDHIVPAVQVSAARARSGPLGGRLSFADNAGRVWSGTFRQLLRSRRGANRASAPPYSLPNGGQHHALAVHGVLDPDRVTIPVILQGSRNDEPPLPAAAQQPPAPAPLTLRATVLIPHQSQSYTLYRYDDFAKVPDRAFNAAATSAVQSWLIPAHVGSSVDVTVNALTSDTVVFRAVPSAAA